MEQRLEILVRQRSALRMVFTKSLKNFDEAVQDGNVEATEITFSILEDKAGRFFKLDEEICQILAEDPGKEEALNSEIENAEKYRSDWCAAGIKFKMYKGNAAPSTTATGDATKKPQINFKLPKLNIVTFNGDPKNWFTFWGFFKQIDSCAEFDEEMKMQYLLQSTGGKAQEFVKTFSSSHGTYKEALKKLKSRFANDKVLIELYVRDLLNLVLNNVSSLTSLVDKLDTLLRCLQNLGVTGDKYACMLYPLVEASVPPETLKAWERQRIFITNKVSLDTAEGSVEELNDLTLLLDFLRSEVEGEERIQRAKGGFTSSNVKGKSYLKPTSSPSAVPTASCLVNKVENKSPKLIITCLFCGKNNHTSQDCGSAQNMDFTERKSFVMNKNACLSCLKIGHRVEKCRFFVKCILCSKKHYPILCPSVPAHNKNPTPSAGIEKVVPASTVASHSAIRNSQVLLQTLRLKIVGPKGYKTVRALCDSGSQHSYILSSCASCLQLKEVGNEKLRHVLFGGMESKLTVHKVYEGTLQSLDDDFNCKLELLEQKTICKDVPRLKSNTMRELTDNGIHISDTGEGFPIVELLLGADILGKILTGKIKQLNENLTAVQSCFGWMVMGKIPSLNKKKNIIAISLHSSKLSDLWCLDTLGIKDPIDIKTKKDLDLTALKYFNDTIIINDENRYEVRLPWLEGHPPLDSFEREAKNRLFTTSRRLIKMNKFDDYQNVFEEWLSKGIIEEVKDRNYVETVRYLPHRPVIKEQSLTTKIRPVFDASAKDHNQVSLNDCLVTGPNLIELIPTILNRFRWGKFGLISDIKKAFLQISINKEERDYLRFFWWDDFNKQTLKIFRHCRVVFGLTTSPFLLMATIYHHLGQVQGKFKQTAAKLKDFFYADNCVASVNSKTDLDKFILESTFIMNQGQFELHGWIHNYNCNEILEHTVKHHVLGLVWDISDDTLQCDIDKIDLVTEKPVTKRLLLSLAQKIFDPIGFTCPVTLVPKLILQECWKLENLSWDSELPENLTLRWRNWLSTLNYLAVCKMARYFGGQIEEETSSIHVFCDASSKAYAACVFLRTVTNNEVKVCLLQAKSRVAPLKRERGTKGKSEVTIPKLELLAALIGVRLLNLIKESINLGNIKTFLWSDSKVVLCWIKKIDEWSTFIRNRVREIQQTTNPNDWNYIPTSLNPADLLSRGCDGLKLYQSSWWEGPSFLGDTPDKWPDHHNDISYDEVEEEINLGKRKTVLSNLSKSPNTEDILGLGSYFSNYISIVKLVGWIKRFAHNTLCVRNKTTKVSGPLSGLEVDQAELTVLKYIQNDVFSGTDSKPMNLIIYVDDIGLKRVKTKLLATDQDDYFCCPILLPDKHPLVDRLIETKHKIYNHAGVQTLVTILRNKYWILRSRKTVRSVLFRCVKCKRFRAKACQAMYSPLPADRTRMSSVFETTGIDLAGPLILKSGQKVWIAIFTCAVYRAVHFELVEDISTNTFLLALRRFISRRGRVKTIYSDNGSNFTGAHNLLKRVEWDEITNYTNERSITWYFNPPSAPWWGGFWERVVGMLKDLLRRNLGCASLRYDELETVVCECEAVINSRPLTYFSEDPEDLIPLTPSMFLQDLTEFYVTDLDTVDSRNLIKRARYVLEIKKKLRLRFKREYLSTLKQNGQTNTTKIRVGDVVLIGTDDKKRINWLLGKVIQLYPGKDNVIRVARLKTKNGEIVRPVQRLFKLETDEDTGKCFRKVDLPQSPTIIEEIKNDKTLQTPDSSTSPCTQIVTKSGRFVKPVRKLDL